MRVVRHVVALADEPLPATLLSAAAAPYARAERLCVAATRARRLCGRPAPHSRLAPLRARQRCSRAPRAACRAPPDARLSSRCCAAGPLAAHPSLGAQAALLERAGKRRGPLFGGLKMAALGPSEATKADLAALMKLWAEPEAAAGSTGARIAGTAALAPPAPALQPAAGEAAPPSFGNLSKGGWLSDFVPQPVPVPPKAVVAPTAAPGGASVAALRCLDASHDAACTKCAPPATCQRPVTASRLP